MNSDATEDIKALMLNAFDQAFQAQIGSLYKVYLQNMTFVSDQQEFTKSGIKNAIAAYRLAIEAVNSWDGS
jgi:hypothetical protein